MNPTVGRIVHFQTYGTPGGEHPSEPVAAMITRIMEPADISPGAVDLCVFYPNGLSFKQAVNQADEPTAGRWNWPPRV